MILITIWLLSDWLWFVVIWYIILVLIANDTYFPFDFSNVTCYLIANDIDWYQKFNLKIIGPL